MATFYGRLAALVLLLLSGFLSAPARADNSTCGPFDERRIVIAVIRAHQVTGVDPYHLLALLLVETRAGRVVGVPGGIIYSRLDRDAIPLLVLARIHKKNPSRICASKPGAKYGGAVGLAQFIPATWLELTGTRVRDTYGLRFTTYRVNHTDVLSAQRIMNAMLNNSTLGVDGVMGRRTERALSMVHGGHGKFNTHSQWMDICPNRFRSRLLGPCTKVALLAAVHFDWVYDRRKDSVSHALRIRGPANPWVPEHAVTGAALLLVEYGYHRNKSRAVGAYRTGPGGVQSAAAGEHVRRVNAALPDARRILRKYTGG